MNLFEKTILAASAVLFMLVLFFASLYVNKDIYLPQPVIENGLDRKLQILRMNNEYVNLQITKGSVTETVTLTLNNNGVWTSRDFANVEEFNKWYEEWKLN